MNCNFCVSEAVSPGHPDKMADQLADRILNECLKQDRNSRVACEVCFGKKAIFITGEISTTAKYDMNNILYQLFNDCGYSEEFLGSSIAEWQIINNISHQSPDIYKAVFKEGIIAAGDQGITQGYACNDTDDFVPLSYALANAVIRWIWDYHIKYKKIGPDAKAQIGIRYDLNKNPYISHLVISAQHPSLMNQAELHKILNECIHTTIPSLLINTDTQIFLNPSGSFILGGPLADSGLTGRKIIVDSYGAMCPHGGGSFSGKDPSKVDRSGAYYARYIAKNIVASGIAEKILLTYSFVIGQAAPVDIALTTFGTSQYSDEYIKTRLHKFINVSVQDMIVKLRLQNPLYHNISSGGHFGKNGSDLPWEKLELTEVFKELLSNA